jgi:hypothetical protein
MRSDQVVEPKLPDGADGVDGVDGVEGVEGVEGTEGVDGVEGKDGVEPRELPRRKATAPTRLSRKIPSMKKPRWRLFEEKMLFPRMNASNRICGLKTYIRVGSSHATKRQFRSKIGSMSDSIEGPNFELDEPLRGSPIHPKTVAGS